MSAIRYGGFGKVTIDMGQLNCVGEPNVIEFGKDKYVLRYKSGEDDFGTLTIEKVAKE